MRAFVIAAILLVTAFVRHGSIYSLSDATGLSPGTVNRILGGMEEIVLAAVIAYLLFFLRKGVWRSVAFGACAIMAIEGAQIVVCRLALGDMSWVHSRTDMCSALVGFPLWPVQVTLYLMIVSYAIASTLRKG